MLGGSLPQGQIFLLVGHLLEHQFRHVRTETPPSLMATPPAPTGGFEHLDHCACSAVYLLVNVNPVHLAIFFVTKVDVCLDTILNIISLHLHVYPFRAASPDCSSKNRTLFFNTKLLTSPPLLLCADGMQTCRVGKVEEDWVHGIPSFAVSARSCTDLIT